MRSTRGRTRISLRSIRATEPYGVRQTANLLNRINAIPPVQSPLQKYFAFRLPQIKSITSPSRPDRGAFRDRHGRWCGMRWTRGVARRATLTRTAKTCGPDAPTLASSFADDPQGDGGKRARSPGRARNKPLKPSRAGMPGETGGPVVTMLVCFYYFAREAAGATSTRHSPRPQRADDFPTTRTRSAPRGCGVVSSPSPRLRGEGRGEGDSPHIHTRG
jgi:hypothetical protein